MRLWRLSGRAFADRLDGGYGLANAGRWNVVGQLVTYCATVPSLCILEKLVHVRDADLLPDDLVMVELSVPDSLGTEIFEEGAPLEADWHGATAISQTHGARWYQARTSPLLRVPSVISRTREIADRNVVISHAHPAAASITIADMRPFVLDDRLL